MHASFRACFPILAGLSLVACGSHVSTGPIDPFVNVNGMWRITSIVRADSTSPVPVDPGTAAEPFRPVFEGMVIRIEGNALRDRAGNRLFESWNASVPNDRYTNQVVASGFAFDFASSGGTPCVWHEELTVQGHAPSRDRMLLDVVIVSSGDCADPAPLAAEATGMFRLTAERIALQAATDGR